jgi:hypothetical protein
MNKVLAFQKANGIVLPQRQAGAYTRPLFSST